MPGGIVYEAGNSKEYKTGSWRSSKPSVDKAKCIKCGQCAMYCPEGCIKITESGAEVDYDYCKGCLICMVQCPVKAIAEKEEC
ncbi:MAG: 4Fe-4S binding protein [Candidatus Diapherotrites archaeon]|nr:4Fe-4S binding protein [Candidatus Diapherotrites archaeon]